MHPHVVQNQCTMTKRLSVALDEELLKEVQALTGARTKKEAIETALRAYVREKRIQGLIQLAGSDAVDWDLGNLKGYRELDRKAP